MSSHQEYECGKGHRWETLDNGLITASPCPICHPPKRAYPSREQLAEWLAQERNYQAWFERTALEALRSIEAAGGPTRTIAGEALRKLVIPKVEGNL